MEAASFSITLVSTYESTRRHSPENNVAILTAMKASNLEISISSYCFDLFKSAKF
jgi:hypothetical protein